MSNAPWLAGMKVVDFSTMGMGPMATAQLQQWGAEVVKVEFCKLGDPLKMMSSFGMASDGCTTEVYRRLNAGKQIWSADLRSPASMQQLYQVVQQADVVVESFPPGVMARWGLGAAELLPDCPHLIYASITAYGQADPRSTLLLHEANVMAENGVLALLHAPGAPWSLHPGPAMTLSYVLCSEVLLRWLARTSAPLRCEDRRIDLSLDQVSRDAAQFLWADLVAAVPPPAFGHMVGAVAHTGVYACARDTALVLSMPEARRFRTLLQHLGVKEAHDDPALLRRQVADVFLTRDAATWVLDLQAVGILVTEVQPWGACLPVKKSPDKRGAK